MLYFSLTDLPPFATRIITIQTELKLSPQSLSDLPVDLEKYLKPQEYIESDHPEIRRVAQILRSPDPLKTIEKVFRWVVVNLRYSGYVGKNRGALFALEHKKGDCTEYADLFVALCRANDIAAHPVGGYVCPQSGVLKARNYHNWGEFYQQGTWKLADPQNRVLMQNGSDYIAMRIIHASADDPMGSYNRFRFEGEGLKVRMN